MNVHARPGAPKDALRRAIRKSSLNPEDKWWLVRFVNWASPGEAEELRNLFGENDEILAGIVAIIKKKDQFLKDRVSIEEILRAESGMLEKFQRPGSL